MRPWIKYSIIGFVAGGALAVFPPFHLLTLLIVIPLSKLIVGSPLLVLMIVTNAVIFGFAGLIIGLFKTRTTVSNSDRSLNPNKAAFIITLVSSLIILIPFSSINFRGLLKAVDYGGFYIPSFIILIYGILIFVASLLTRKQNTTKIGSVVSIIFGATPILIFVTALVSKTVYYYVFYYFLGELLGGGNNLIVFLLIISSVLSIIGGIIGLKNAVSRIDS